MLRGIGSARTARGSAEYEIAESTAAGLVRAGYAVITRTGHRHLPAGPAAPGHTRADLRGTCTHDGDHRARYRGKHQWTAHGAAPQARAASGAPRAESAGRGPPGLESCEKPSLSPGDKDGFSGGSAKLARIVRELCAVAGRCC